jgi:hypothetical protein
MPNVTVSLENSADIQIRIGDHGASRPVVLMPRERSRPARWAVLSPWMLSSTGR